MENNKKDPTVTAKLLMDKHNNSENRREEHKWALSDKEKRKKLATLENNFED